MTGVRACLQTRETYAVKVLPKRRDKVDDDVVATKIQREVDILRAVQDGPTIVDMYGAFEDGEQAYVVMEELSGGSLGKLVFGGAPLTERELAFLCHDILTALAHVHQRGVVFGDVKPSNFLFTNNARLVSRAFLFVLLAVAAGIAATFVATRIAYG